MAKVRKAGKSVITDEAIINKIYLIRGQKVMLDKDLADMYAVETKVLKQSVKRNAERFPKDFMFTLTRKEFQHLRSQFVTSSWGGTRYLLAAFTEQGVAMLAGVLSSSIAIQVHIQIIRIFSKMKEYNEMESGSGYKLEHTDDAGWTDVNGFFLLRRNKIAKANVFLLLNSNKNVIRSLQN